VPDFLKYLFSIFDFRFWVDRITEINLAPRNRQTQISFNQNFNGGLQKTLLLGVLLFSSNIAYRRDAAIPQFDATMIAIAISGISVYLLTFLLTFSFVKDIHVTRYLVNLIILHIALSAIAILILSLCGFADFFDRISSVVGASILDRDWFWWLVSYLFALFCVFFVSVFFLYNSYIVHAASVSRLVRKPSLNLKVCFIRLFLISAYTSAILDAYVTYKLTR
jgi:hypothetical protein